MKLQEEFDYIKMEEQIKCYKSITEDEIVALFCELELLGDYTSQEDRFRKLTNELYLRKFKTELSSTSIDHIVCEDFNFEDGCQCSLAKAFRVVCNPDLQMTMCGYLFDDEDGIPLKANYGDLRKSTTPEELTKYFHKRAGLLQDLIREHKVKIGAKKKNENK